MGFERGADIAQRLRRLAIGVLRIARDLRGDVIGRTLVTQLTNSATGAGSNYEEARGAESRSDFIHKVGIAVKELREAKYWLEIARDATLIRTNLDPLIDEANQLISILVASRKTAAAKRWN